MRIEAAAYRGKPVSFEIIGPWSTAERDNPLSRLPGAEIAAMIGTFLVLTVITAGIYFARRNLRLGRGDRRSALKVVLFFQALMAIAWILTEHHVAGFWELVL